MNFPSELEEKSLAQNIMVEVEVPTKHYYTWQSTPLMNLSQVSYMPSELDDEILRNPTQSAKVTIQIDFLTLSRLELDLTLSNSTKKQLRRALI